ncbi:hypothetical protein WJX73_004293 [Symbiochloris irregularis]|uniref:Uncharacterized protein n=1 Tax=Symbiochloris irregularis TaxID=706552 RepID=A0AAW1PV20_9CHLO
MSHKATTLKADDQPAADAQPAGSWLWKEVEDLDPIIRQQGLARAGIADDQPLLAHDPAPGAWGFASRLPSLQDLFSQCDTSQSGPVSPGPGYLDSLRQSHTFLSPDCVPAMAEAYGLQPLLTSLTGSTVKPPPSDAETAEVDKMRATLKHDLALAWSQEAVQRGIEMAKQKRYYDASQHYRKALELNRNNVDAWVARGAANANLLKFDKAINDFQQALRLDANHANAAKYLQTIHQRMQQSQEQATPPSKSAARADSGPGAESPSAHESEPPTLRQTPLAPQPAAGRDSSSDGSGSSDESGSGEAVYRQMCVCRRERKAARRHSKRKRRKRDKEGSSKHSKRHRKA